MKKIIFTIVFLLGFTCVSYQHVYGQTTSEKAVAKTSDNSEKTKNDNGGTNSKLTKNSSKTDENTGDKKASSSAKNKSKKTSSETDEDAQDKKASGTQSQESERQSSSQDHTGMSQTQDNDEHSDDNAGFSNSQVPNDNETNAEPDNTNFNLNLSLIQIGVIALVALVFIFFIGISYIRSKDALMTSYQNKKKLKELDGLKNYTNVNIRSLNEQISSLKKQLEDYSAKLQQRQSYQPNNNVGINTSNQAPDNNQGYRQNEYVNRQPVSRILYLGAPNNAGFFSSASERRTYESIFQLTTRDGKSGTFDFINDRDSINTAILAVEAIKIACKINNVGILPSRVSTNIEGNAEMINGRWRITSKGLITFEA